MITFLSLPFMYHNLYFNIFLNFQKENIFNIPLKIDSIYGNFPFCYWNGDINNNYTDKLPVYNDFYDYFLNKNLPPVRLDCSNILLVQEDLNDIHANTILEAGNKSGNLVEFSDLGVFNYIKENYKNYNFIVSRNIDFIHPLDLDIINCFTDQEDFYLFNLPIRFYKDENFLQLLKNKSKIEINIALKCQCNHNNEEEKCRLQEQHNQIDFSGYSIYENCCYTNNYDNLNLINEINYFTNLGFSHFKIDAPPYSKINLFNNYLIDNLIKTDIDKLLFKNNYNLFLKG